MKEAIKISKKELSSLTDAYRRMQPHLPYKYQKEKPTKEDLEVLCWAKKFIKRYKKALIALADM